MKFVIDPGHNCPPKDTGAVGILNEEKVAAEVAKELKNILALRGHDVVLTQATDGSSVTNSLSQRCQLSNRFDPDLFISLHCNAYQTTDNPMGTEVFAVSEKGEGIAHTIEDAIVDLGFKSRGVKDGSHLFVLKYTQAVAVLVELFFIDSKADCDTYAKTGAVKLATAIANAVEGKTQPPKPAVESTPLKYSGASGVDWSNPESRLSKYFKVVEATKGEAARTPKAGSTEAQNILRLAAELDKLREAYKKGIGVSSWYRPPAINRAVGGVANSQHINGGAADIYPVDGSDIFEFQKWCDQHWFGALGYGASKGFIHLDIRNGKGFGTGGDKGVRWEY